MDVSVPTPPVLELAIRSTFHMIKVLGWVKPTIDMSVNSETYSLWVVPGLVMLTVEIL